MEGNRQEALDKLSAHSGEVKAERERSQKQSALKLRLRARRMDRSGKPGPAAAMAEPEHPSIKRAGGIEKAIKHGRLNQSTDYGWQDRMCENIYDYTSKKSKPKVRKGKVRTTLSPKGQAVWDRAQARNKRKKA